MSDPTQPTIAKRNMAEYTHTVGIGPYQLEGAVPSFSTLRALLRDGARVQYRVTSRAFQEIGRGELDYVANQLIRVELWVPGDGPVDWGPGRKLVYILDS